MSLFNTFLFNRRKSRRFYGYLFSYLIVVCVSLLIVGSVVYSTFFSAMTKEIEEANMSLLRQTREAIDTRTKEMNRIAYRISVNGELIPYKLEACVYSLTRTIGILNDYKSTNGFLRDVALYYSSRNDDRVYAASGVYSLDSFFRDKFRFEFWSKDELSQALNTLGSPLMRPLEYVTIAGEESKRLAAYIAPLSYNAGKPYGVVMFLIEEQSFAGILLNALNKYEGYSYLMNEKNEIIASASTVGSYEKAKDVLKEIGIASQPQGISSVKASGGKLSVSKLTSTVNGWSYVTVIPTDQMMAGIHLQQNVFFASVFAVLLLGTVMALFFARRNYRPLQRLFHSIGGSRFESSAAGRYDEYSIITHAVGEMTRENTDLLSRLKTHASLAKEQLLLKMIYGQIKPGEAMEAMKRLTNVSFLYPNFAVLLFIIDDYNRFVEQNSPSMQAILKYSLVNIVEELSGEVGGGYGLELPDKREIALVLNMREQFGEEQLGKIADDARAFFRQYFKHTLTVCGGGIYSGEAGLRMSFLEACGAARYRIVRGDGKTIFYSETAGQSSSAYWYPFEPENRIVVAVKQGKRADMESAVRELTASIGRQELSAEEITSICLGVMQTVMKTMIEMGGEWEHPGAKAFSLSGLETLEELEAHLLEYCAKACDLIHSKKESKNVNLLDQVIAYADVHFSDPMLCLNGIADQFGVSPSYLTRFFKDQTGYPLIHYIDMIRMEKAKELMRTTGAKMKDIVKQVGYVDQTNFNRKFKQREGITPSEYRDVCESLR